MRFLLAWSVALLATVCAYAQPNIKAGEYFVGTNDPGAGSGSSGKVGCCEGNSPDAMARSSRVCRSVQAECPNHPATPPAMAHSAPSAAGFHKRARAPVELRTGSGRGGSAIPFARNACARAGRPNSPGFARKTEGSGYPAGAPPRLLGPLIPVC